MRNESQNETYNDPENSVTELRRFHKPTSGLNICSKGYFEDYARIRLEQNNDIVLRNLRAKIERKPFDESGVGSDYQYQPYLQNLTLVEIKQKVLKRRYYTNTGTTSHYQLLLPVQLLEEVLQALHRHNSNHPDITQMIQENRQNITTHVLLKTSKKGK